MSNHREQKEKALWASLTRAGIGRAYHNRSLLEDPFPSELAEWVRDPFADLSAGRGWSFIGDTVAYEAAMLTARALHIQGQGCKVVSLHRLAAWVRADADELDRVFDVKGLFVTDFWAVRHEMPLQGWVASGVEAYLSERLDDNRSVFIHREPDWDNEELWSRRFRNLITERNREAVL